VSEMGSFEFAHGFWWIFPLIMFLFCCLTMKRGGMGCCMRVRRRSRERASGPLSDQDNLGRPSHVTRRAERKAEAETLKRSFDRLNHRLEKLEDTVTAKEFDWDRRYKQS
jgi:hypothetical protein